MFPCSPSDAVNLVHVGMGQAIIGSQPDQLVAVLGSCVALSLYSSEHRKAILGHIVLPHTSHPTTMPVKYADIAVPRMLAVLRMANIQPGEVVAKVAGGACMFGDSGLPRIGESNVAAVLESLRAADIPMAGAHVGGAVGRRIVFDCDSGDLTIETIGHPAITL